jgi:outer membrane protein with beta-barrel domain
VVLSHRGVPFGRFSWPGRIAGRSLSIIEQFASHRRRFRGALKADGGIGQKDEIAIRLTCDVPIPRTADAEIGRMPAELPHTNRSRRFEEAVIMKRWIAVLVAAVALVGSGSAYAQEHLSAPGRVEVSIIPGGGVFFTEAKDTQEPSFGNYGLGGAVGVNLTRFIGFEGEVSGALGVSQHVQFANIDADRRTPHILNYSGNVVLSAPGRSSVVPYVTGGVGGLSLFETQGLGIEGTETFLTGNVGGGVKWYAGRWGLRGDYRFVGVKSRDDAPAFFGRETRYGHRIYGAVILNLAR